MLKNTNRLASKMIFACLIINTLPVHLPMYGSALPKGQELAALKREIRTDIRSIKKTKNTLIILQFAVPAIVIAGGVAATILAIATGVVVFKGLEKWLLESYRKKLDEFSKEYKKVTYGFEKRYEKIKESFLEQMAGVQTEIEKLSQAKKKSTEEKIRRLKSNLQEIHSKFKTKRLEMSDQRYLELIKVEKDLMPDVYPSKRITKNKTIITAIVAAISAISLKSSLILAGLSFVGLTVGVVAADKKAKRLEALEKQYPGILTLQQGRALAEFKKLSSDPKMQGLIRNMHLRVALTKIVDEAVKQHPLLVEELGGPKKASKAFKNYAKRKWNETTLQKALDVGVGKIMAAKFKFQLRHTRSKLRSLENKLVAQVKKSDWMVAPLKRTLNSTAQQYIKQADAIVKDLANQLIEAVEAGKINLQTGPIIEL